ncbi:MAG: flagellar basal body P-ring formation protein FlgA [Gammaproteobacteria bacterium]|nr:flagellar basal body P-ring formation protein FlgA [Gammaproteobacteria bacterium]
MATASWQDHDAIRTAAEDAVRARLNDQNGEVLVRADALDPRLRLPACETALLGETPQALAESGRVSARVSCTAASSWRLFVPVQVSVQKDLVVTTTPLERGKVLAAADVKLAKRDVGSAPNGYLTSLEAAIGQVARRNVPAGAVLSPVQLDAPVLVVRGQPVTLEVRSGGIVVRMAGLAKADGSLGESIPVQNTSSGRVLQGIVRNEKSIEVLLP